MTNIFAAPGTGSLTQRLTRDAAERIASNWWRLALNGAVLIVAGVLIFSIDWSVRSLSTFIGALFIFEGIAAALTSGIAARPARTNFVAGGALDRRRDRDHRLAQARPDRARSVPRLVVDRRGNDDDRRRVRRAQAPVRLVAVADRRPLEVPLGVLALADPGATLAALVTVGGIWAVAVGVMRIILAFQVKDLPKTMEEALAEPTDNGKA